MKRKRSGTKAPMPPLDKALACAARREGKSIHYIATALHRDQQTIRRLLDYRKVAPPVGCVFVKRGRKRKVTDALAARMRYLRDNYNLSYTTLSERFQIPRETLRRAVNKYVDA